MRLPSLRAFGLSGIKAIVLVHHTILCIRRISNPADLEAHKENRMLFSRSPKIASSKHLRPNLRSSLIAIGLLASFIVLVGPLHCAASKP